MEINRLIELHDVTLRELNYEWKKEKDSEKKQEVMDRIDRALDYRLQLMSTRDLENDIKI